MFWFTFFFLFYYYIIRSTVIIHITPRKSINRDMTESIDKVLFLAKKKKKKCKLRRAKFWVFSYETFESLPT